jgi:hypothetical protein
MGSLLSWPVFDLTIDALGINIRPQARCRLMLALTPAEQQLI